MSKPHLKTRQALEILQAIEAPREQQNERSALTLLALADVRPGTAWSEASSPQCGITGMMNWMKAHYEVNYAPNTRETIRRQTVHQFLQMGLLVENPGCPVRPVNSPKWCYQLTGDAVRLLQSYGGKNWETQLRAYLAISRDKNRLLVKRRNLPVIPVRMPEGRTINLTAGGQNVLIKKIVEEFCPRYVPGGKVLLLGDASDKNVVADDGELSRLGVVLDAHGKAPDVVVYDSERKWLVVIEAVTSHGPIDQTRRNEIADLFETSGIGIVYVTAFADTSGYIKFARRIAWETEVWIADAPEHLIHYNGTRFLGPYGD